ncbi:MAG: hypothetical protein U5L98_09090 [Halomonas sp.]|uniref:hypothetical protein n=1 Tax=Halomonas sp. TaxID=1486246 RepID=UPI002ACECDFD|nr:hypothetical protein [Halomonas sp.]MDZ7852779.1 hypothetical protein [Halomonas sp.]
MRIAEPSLLIRISRSWHEGISTQALFEATRGVWKIGERREQVELVFAVASGIVREVYRVHAWHPAGTTLYHTRVPVEVAIQGRWEFTGELADELLRSRYLGTDVSDFFSPGSSNPITVCQCPDQPLIEPLSCGL